MLGVIVRTHADHLRIPRGGRVDDLARVEQVVGVKQALHLTEGGMQARSVKLFIEETPRDSFAVFARRRAFILDGKREDCL